MSIQITGATMTSKTLDLSREQKADLFADLFGEDERQLYVDEIPEDATAGNAMMADGMYNIFTNTIGRFITKDKKNNVELEYLKNVGQPSFKMLLPKIPRRFLQGMYDFFKKIAETNRNEVMVQVFWNKVTNEYEMHVPEQQVAGASISFDRSKGAMLNGDLLWVMDVHSHVYMNNFFSGTDSADEVSTRIFGVIGKLDQEGLHMCVRAGHSGNFIDLKVEDVFDMEDTEVYVVPESDYSKVTEKTAVHKSITTGFYGGKTKATGNTYTGSYYGSNSSYDYTASQKIGDTGYKVGYYGIQINSKLNYISEADLNATDEFESCATFGNALRGLYMVRGREEKGFYDAQTAIALLAASRFLIDYYNEKGGDMKQVGYNALRTVYEQAIARSKVSPDAGYAEECAQFFDGIQMALDSVSEELKALSAQEVLKSESEVADVGEEKK